MHARELAREKGGGGAFYCCSGAEIACRAIRLDSTLRANSRERYGVRVNLFRVSADLCSAEFVSVFCNYEKWYLCFNE